MPSGVFAVAKVHAVPWYGCCQGCTAQWCVNVQFSYWPMPGWCHGWLAVWCMYSGGQNWSVPVKNGRCPSPTGGQEGVFKRGVSKKVGETKKNGHFGNLVTLHCDKKKKTSKKLKTASFSLTEFVSQDTNPFVSRMTALGKQWTALCSF